MGAAGVEAILTELIRIDSVNPRLAADGGGEAEIAAWIERFCDEHELDHAIQRVEGCGPNVPGSGTTCGSETAGSDMAWGS